MRAPTRIELILGTAICGVLNVPGAILPGHYWNGAALGLCAGSCAMQIVLAVMSSRREKPSSPSQQPTSSTSPSPSPSPSPNPNQIPFRSLTVSPSGAQPSSLWGQTAVTTPIWLSGRGHLPEPALGLPELGVERRTVPVVGFRAWQVIESFKLGIGTTGQIGALNRSFGLWRPGVNVAQCYAGHFSHYPSEPHRVADPTCSCGFYVLTDLDKVPYQLGMVTTPGAVQIIQGVVGAVVGWGRVVQHGDEGWRAEKVQVIAFLDCKISIEHLEQTERMAAAYGVPVVGRKALELLAAEYGERLTQKQLS